MRLTRDDLLKWIGDQEHYVKVREIYAKFGLGEDLHNLRLISRMLENGDIVITPTHEVLITAITSEKLQELVDKSVPIKERNTNRKDEGLA